MKLRGPFHHHPRAAKCHRLVYPKSLEPLMSSKPQLRLSQRQLFRRRHLRQLFSRRLSLRLQLSWHLQLFSHRLLFSRQQLFSLPLF